MPIFESRAQREAREKLEREIKELKAKAQAAKTEEEQKEVEAAFKAVSANILSAEGSGVISAVQAYTFQETLKAVAIEYRARTRGQEQAQLGTSPIKPDTDEQKQRSMKAWREKIAEAREVDKRAWREAQEREKSPNSQRVDGESKNSRNNEDDEHSERHK